MHILETLGHQQGSTKSGFLQETIVQMIAMEMESVYRVHAVVMRVTSVTHARSSLHHARTTVAKSEFVMKTLQHARVPRGTSSTIARFLRNAMNDVPTVSVRVRGMRTGIWDGHVNAVQVGEGTFVMKRKIIVPMNVRIMAHATTGLVRVSLDGRATTARLRRSPCLREVARETVIVAPMVSVALMVRQARAPVFVRRDGKGWIVTLIVHSVQRLKHQR